MKKCELQAILRVLLGETPYITQLDVILNEKLDD